MFALVEKMSTIKIVIPLVEHNDWNLYQYNIKFFINWKLDEIIFVNLTPKYESRLRKNIVCRLNQTIYGLK